MRITKRQLRRIIREAQWGNFTGGAAPLDEPPMDSGPMTPEEQQRVFDILVDSGSDPHELKASGDYPDLMLDEADDSTEKYDDDSALRGDQSKLPDALQKGIIDKTVADREEKEKNESMKITKRQLRRIIKEEKEKLLLKRRVHRILRESKPAATPDHVLNALTNGKNAITGDPFMNDVMQALEQADYQEAANAVMNALWIDDVWREEEKALEDMLSAAGRESWGAPTEDAVATIGAEWLTRYRAGELSTEAGKQKEMEKWG